MREVANTLTTEFSWNKAEIVDQPAEKVLSAKCEDWL